MKTMKMSPRPPAETQSRRTLHYVERALKTPPETELCDSFQKIWHYAAVVRSSQHIVIEFASGGRLGVPADTSPDLDRLVGVITDPPRRIMRCVILP